MPSTTRSIDLDLAAALMARDVDPDAILLLTDVLAGLADYGLRSEHALERAMVAHLRTMRFPAGSLGPKGVRRNL
jgi:carbamate kinase